MKVFSFFIFDFTKTKNEKRKTKVCSIYLTHTVFNCHSKNDNVVICHSFKGASDNEIITMLSIFVTYQKGEHKVLYIILIISRFIL